MFCVFVIDCRANFVMDGCGHLIIYVENFINGAVVNHFSRCHKTIVRFFNGIDTENVVFHIHGIVIVKVVYLFDALIFVVGIMGDKISVIATRKIIAAAFEE